MARRLCSFHPERARAAVQKPHAPLVQRGRHCGCCRLDLRHCGWSAGFYLVIAMRTFRPPVYEKRGGFEPLSDGGLELCPCGHLSLAGSDPWWKSMHHSIRSNRTPGIRRHFQEVLRRKRREKSARGAKARSTHLTKSVDEGAKPEPL